MHETYDIPKGNLEYLQERFAELGKKARKLGLLHGPTLVIEREKQVKREVNGVPRTECFYEVSFIGDTPKLAGWKLVAVIQPFGNERVIRTVPGESCPEAYRTSDYTCDQCNVVRKRNETFVLLHDDGHYKQVGRNCLSDFLGGASPESIIRWATWLGEAAEACESAGDYCGGGPTGWSLEHFIQVTSVVIRRFGWMSRKKAEEIELAGGLVSTTRSLVTSILTCKPNDHDTKRWINENNLHPEPIDAELAKAAIAWGETLDGGSDYEHNLGVICRAGWVDWKQSGIAASLIAAFKHHQDRAEELRVERETKARGHVGEVGKRQVFKATVKKLHYLESDYGVRTLVRFEDEPGNILIWFASGEPGWLKEGETYEFTGTVKKHDDYKGTKQTVLQRVVQGSPKQKKAKVK